MDMKYQGGKNEWEKKANGKVTAVFEMDCQSCAKKVKEAAFSLKGFEDVKLDCATNRLTVTGKEDPTVMKEMLEKKAKKIVQLVSSQPREDDRGDEKPEEKSETEEEYEKPKEISTVVLKIRLHCKYGCVNELKKIVGKFNGVEKVDVAAGKDLVTVKGTMDVKELAAYLKAKLKRSVEIVAPKNQQGGDKRANISDGDKKEKDDDYLCLTEVAALLWMRKMGLYY